MPRASKSPPTRGRGLKLWKTGPPPLGGRGLKRIRLDIVTLVKGRPPRGGAD